MPSILLTLFNHSCLHCANFFSTGSTLSSSKISSFLLLPNKLYPAMRLMNFIYTVFSFLLSLCFNVQVLQPYKSGGGSKNIVYYQPKLSFCWIWFRSMLQNSNHFEEFSYFLSVFLFVFMWNFPNMWRIYVSNVILSKHYFWLETFQ